MTILVTGGCGYIGSHILRQLAESKQEAIVLDNLETGSEKALIHKHKLLVADFADPEVLEHIFTENQIDAVIHLAASTVVPESLENPLKYYTNNTAKTLKLLEKCMAHKIKNFVFSSTAAVYGTSENGMVYENSPTLPINPYGSSKLMSEQMIQDFAKAYEMKFVILRYFNVAGADPLSRIGQMAKKTSLLITVACEAALGKRDELCIFGTDYPTSDGTGIRDYIHVEDLAAAHLKALEYLAGNEESLILNVGYGKGHSVREVVNVVKKVSGINLPVVETSRRPGDSPILIANNDKILKYLKWKPKFDSLETIVEHAWNWESRKNINQ